MNGPIIATLVTIVAVSLCVVAWSLDVIFGGPEKRARRRIASLAQPTLPPAPMTEQAAVRVAAQHYAREDSKRRQTYISNYVATLTRDGFNPVDAEAEARRQYDELTSFGAA